MKLLKLPCEVQFTPQLMGDFLVGCDCIRPLAHARYATHGTQVMVMYVCIHMYLISLTAFREFIVAMEEHITSQEDLLLMLLPNIRLWYTTFFSSDKHNWASRDRTRQGIIDEVSILLSSFIH